MYKFIKIKDENNVHDISNVKFEFEAKSYDDLLEQFEYFLKACGFHFKGVVCIAEEEYPPFDEGESE